jgi:hypothetical protein
LLSKPSAATELAARPFTSVRVAAVQPTGTVVGQDSISSLITLQHPASTMPYHATTSPQMYATIAVQNHSTTETQPQARPSLQYPSTSVLTHTSSVSQHSTAPNSR